MGPDGTVLGTHRGLHHFTIGQRGKLGVAVGERMYVKQLDQKNHCVHISPRDDVLSSECLLENVHWISGTPHKQSFTCEVRPRYRSTGATAQVELAENQSVKVTFNEPQFALTPGQAAVFYLDHEVLGGGWIKKSENEKKI